MTEDQKDLLRTIYFYFYDRADADHDGERYIGNDAMRFVNDLLTTFPDVEFK
jgi:hypothetical protein